jgi:hypothetical protein
MARRGSVGKGDDGFLEAMGHRRGSLGDFRWSSGLCLAAARDPAVSADALVGRWGLGSYHEDADRARTEIAARSQCRQPYVIGKGASGGVVMHLADSPKPTEVFLSGDPNGRSFLGPSGATPEQSDLQILSFDRKVIVARWIDAEISARYGTMVYVRCGA